MSTSKRASTANPILTDLAAPPPTWVEPKKLGIKGKRPKNGIQVAAPTLAAELRKNAAALANELGPKAVDPEQLAAALDLAYEWTGTAKKTASLDRYARSQRGASWDAAITLMAGMKDGVRFALSRDATFADRFPDVAKTFAVKRRGKKKPADDAAPTASPDHAPAHTTTTTEVTAARRPPTAAGAS
jgi:hypothetical protein